MSEPLVESFFSPTTTAGAVTIVAAMAFFGFGGGEWLFGGPSAHQARYMRENYEETCVGKGREALSSDYCRTHGFDGQPLSEAEIAARDRKREAMRVQRQSKPPAANRADFEALLQDASR